MSADIIDGVAAEQPTTLEPQQTSPLLFGFPTSVEQFRNLQAARYLGQHFSAPKLISSPASRTKAVEPVKARVTRNAKEFLQEQEEHAEAKTFADATGLASRVNKVADLAMEFDGTSSDKDGSKDGSVTIASPDQKRWWHVVTDKFTMEDSRSRRGGRIEVGSDGDRSWTLSPLGDRYSSDGSTIYVENSVGYQFSEDSVKKLEGETLQGRLTETGFADDERSHLPYYEAAPVVDGLFQHEAKKSGLGPAFGQALAEMEYH